MSGLALPRAPRATLRPRLQPPAISVVQPDAARRRPAIWQRSAGPLAVSLFGHAALLAAGLAATLLLPTAPPAPVLNPTAISIELAISPGPTIQPAPADLGDGAPPPQPAPDQLAVPPAADMAAVVLDPAVPPVSIPAPPPMPPRRHQHARPVDRAAIKGVIGKPAPVKPASAPPGAVLAGPSAMPTPATDAGPVPIVSPRFRLPPRPPVYPRRAIALHIEGEALIGALLDSSGMPHDMRVLRSSGHPMLDHAALDAVGSWAFEPGRRAGHPVAARIEIPVRFTLR